MRAKFSPRKLPPLSKEQDEDESEGDENAEEENNSEAEEKKEKTKTPIKDSDPSFHTTLPWDVRCLIYKHLDYATLTDVAEHSVFPEVQKCVREIILEPTTEDAEGRQINVKIQFSFLEKFPQVRKLSGPVRKFVRNKKEIAYMEWGKVSFSSSSSLSSENNTALTSKNLQFLQQVKALNYVEFAIEISEAETSLKETPPGELIDILFKRPPKANNFRVIVTVLTEKGRVSYEIEIARYAGGIEFSIPASLEHLPIVQYLTNFKRYWLTQNDVQYTIAGQKVKIGNYTLLQKVSPNFEIGIPLAFQAKVNDASLAILQSILRTKYPAHIIFLQERQ